MRMTDVKTFMSGAPVAIEPGASVVAALDLMIEHGFRHLPVVDGSRCVVGVVAFSDLRAELPVPLSLSTPLSSADHEALRDTTVAEIMAEAPATARDETALSVAVQALVDHRISCLPVVDEDGRLTGIITETDCLQALVTVLWTEERDDGD
jgi:acetoin utilization protein AcuB